MDPRVVSNLMIRFVADDRRPIGSRALGKNAERRSVEVSHSHSSGGFLSKRTVAIMPCRFMPSDLT